jgi:hypothetical protein
VDGIAAIESRIATIQTTLASLQPVPPATATTRSAAGGVPPSPPGATSSSFATALATEVSRSASSTSVAGYRGAQLDNADAILAAGRRLGLSLRDQTIGVMTAMGESSLQVLNHGDKVGPDSRGLFQQRDNGAWGTLAQRMDPTASATSFFSALTKVAGRGAMSPTQVAHTVQRNADPQHYATYWDDAVAVVSRLTGATPAQINGR